VIEKFAIWWERIQEIAPWAWRTDPYLEGMTEEQFNWLRSLDEPPTEIQQWTSAT